MWVNECGNTIPFALWAYRRNGIILPAIREALALKGPVIFYVTAVLFRVPSCASPIADAELSVAFARSIGMYSRYEGRRNWGLSKLDVVPSGNFFPSSLARYTAACGLWRKKLCG